MSRTKELNIHIVTPVRNEEDYLPHLAESILSQKERPFRWIIVDDGSSDRTLSIIDRLEKQFDWIKSIRLKDRGYRARGYGNTLALKMGFEQALQCSRTEVLGALDADITFDELTIEKVKDAFLKDQKLGIYGGEIVEFKNGVWVPPAILPEDFVRGACKFYRKSCYQDIGGIITRRGWDSIDNIKAIMRGWDVKRDVALLVKHHRPVGAADGFARDQYKAGRDAYYIGSDPVLVLIRGLRKMFRSKPYLIGGFIFLVAYFGNNILMAERYPDPELRKYVRKRHREILIQGFYKW